MITHILRDGTVLKDITGHVVRVKDAETVYKLLKERKKHANELDDKYEYQSKKNKAEEPLYNSKEDDS